MKIVLSPCLYCKNEETFDLNMLHETIDFIDKYLNIPLDEYTNAFYSEERLIPPIFESYNKYNEYAQVISILRKLKIDGESIEITEHDIPYKIDEECKYEVINPQEFQYIIDYIYQDGNSYMLFLGEQNQKFDNVSLNLTIRNSKHLIPVIKDPWLEKSDIFNKYIKSSASDMTSYFPNKILCEKLDELMKTEAKSISGMSKGSHYKKYGEIIAYRNNYDDYPVPDPFESDTNYYIRNDRKYILSVDLVHGTFEVFHGNNELWFAEYDFSGNKLEEPTTKKDLDNMRQNHRIHKRH